MMNRAFTFHPNLVLRTPSRPFNSQFDEHFIRQFLSDAQFAEALYVASPALYEECLKWHQGTLTDRKRIEKMVHALVKYYCRTSSRCTPFGLFAGCSVVNWGTENCIRLDEAPYGRHTRLDMHYLCALARHLAELPPVREKLRYFPNSSTYQVGDEIRYIEYRYEQEVRQYQISSVTAPEYLLRVLSASEAGLPISALAACLMDVEDSLTEEDCRNFVGELIESQLLVSELEPSVTGKSFLQHILDVLARIVTHAPGDEETNVTVLLREVQAWLKALDASVKNAPAQYEQILQQLQTLDVPLAKNMLFQVDLSVVPAPLPVLDRQLQDQLLEGLHVLSVLTPQWVNPQMEAFKTLFIDRYGDQEVPLLEVLDTESGIGYSTQGGGINTALTEDLVLSGGESKEHIIGHLKAQQFIYRMLLEAQKNGVYSVAIDPADLKPFEVPDQQFPPSMAVLFRLVDSRNILLEGITGSSAVNLLGRFAHGNRNIEEIIRQITKAEQQANPDVVFAEVNHLPQSRVGNILARPVFRDYEIPYLTQSSLPPDAQLPLRDLFISLKDNRITLRSRRLNKVVVPRLGTAHNCSHDSLPVYHFLCDLQTQDLQSGLSFNWEPVPPGVVFLPRVTYKNLMLHPATWQFSQGDLRNLLNGEAHTLPARFQAFRTTWRLPRLFTLTDGDNELLVDAENPLTVKAWLDTIKNYDTVKLREFLFDPDGSPVTNAQNRPYVNQFIALLMNEKQCYAESKKSVAYAGASQQRKFWFGSEWLYYKLYCGVKSSDRILLEAIQPLSQELISSGLIDKWFFIRYADPNAHLRIRFHLNDVAGIGEVVRWANHYLQPYMEKELIWKSQIDTYVRELERYGHQTTEISESLFCYDSLVALEILEQTLGDDQENLRWLWGVRSVDELLTAFGYTLPDKQMLIGIMKEAFAREFGMNKSLKLQLDAKYRSIKTMLSRFLNPEGELVSLHPSIFERLSHRDQLARKLVERIGRPEQQQQLGVDLDNLVSSHVHMLLNRLIPANQRLHEMVIYDFLFRQYQGQAAMQRQ